MTRHSQTVIGGNTGPHVEPVAARARFRWSADVVRHLDEEVDWALTSNPTGPAEIAGILLGQSGRHIQIRDFRPVLLLRKEDHEYALTGPGRREFARKMAEFRWIPELSVVGFYRSHMGDGLELSEEDLGLLQTCFRDTSQVVLLIKPTGDRSCSAKLFVGNQGQLLSEFHSDDHMGLPRWLGLWQHLSTNVPRDRPSAAKETTAPVHAATPTCTGTASCADTVAPAPVALRKDTPSPGGKELPDLAYLYAIMATSQAPVALDRGAKYRHIFIFAALAAVALLVGYFMLKA